MVDANNGNYLQDLRESTPLKYSALMIRIETIVGNWVGYTTARERFTLLQSASYPPEELWGLNPTINFEGSAQSVIHDLTKTITYRGMSIIPYLTAIREKVDETDRTQKKVAESLDKLLVELTELKKD